MDFLRTLFYIVCGIGIALALPFFLDHAHKVMTSDLGPVWTESPYTGAQP